DLTGQPRGTYDVQVSNGTQTTTLDQAFTVEAGASNPVQLQLIPPASLRFGRPGSVLVLYTNTGNTDVVAPLLELDSGGLALMKLPAQSDYAGTSVQFLALSGDGPAGILRPGEHGMVAIDVTEAQELTHVPIDFTLSVADASQPIDWASQKDD